MVFILKDVHGRLLKQKDNRVWIFEYHSQAIRCIQDFYGNSPYIKIVEWNIKKG